MKKKSKHLVLGTAGLVTSLALVLGGCAQKASTSNSSTSESSSLSSETSSYYDVSTSSSSSDLDSSSSTTSDSLKLKPETISGFELSPMVKDIVGTYSGLQVDEQFDDHISQYQVRINADGSYTALSRKLTVIPDSVTNYNLFERVYFDSANTMKYALPSIERNGKRYSYDTDFTFERGVVVEKFGKLNLRPLSTITTQSNNHQSTFTTTDGQSNLALDLVAGNIDINNVPDTEDKFQSFVEKNFAFDIPFSMSFTESQSYASDGHVYLYGFELAKSDDVDPIVSKDLDQLLDWKDVSTIFTTPNGVLQVWAIQKGIYQYEKPDLVTGLGDAKVYAENGDSITPEVAFRDQQNKRVYIYWKGKIAGITEANGSYIFKTTNW